MTPAEYLAALIAAGIPRGLPSLEIDHRAARMLKVSERTARRWRDGTVSVPGPVEVALRCLSGDKRRHERSAE